jgi:hypothetical protein
LDFTLFCARFALPGFVGSDARVVRRGRCFREVHLETKEAKGNSVAVAVTFLRH